MNAGSCVRNAGLQNQTGSAGYRRIFFSGKSGRLRSVFSVNITESADRHAAENFKPAKFVALLALHIGVHQQYIERGRLQLQPVDIFGAACGRLAVNIAERIRANRQKPLVTLNIGLAHVAGHRGRRCKHLKAQSRRIAFPGVDGAASQCVKRYIPLTRSEHPPPHLSNNFPMPGVALRITTVLVANTAAQLPVVHPLRLASSCRRDAKDV